MKKIYLFVFIAFATICNSQIVNIPDANLKYALLNQGNPFIDTNFDGEIQYTEAEAISILKLSHNYVQDYTGLEAFTNVSWLEIFDANVTQFDFSIFPLLSYLDCHENEFSVLDLQQLPNLSYLNCAKNQITTLDLSGNPLLITLDFSENSVETFDATMLPLLITLNTSYNNLTALAVDGLTNLITLNCSGNELATLNLEGTGSLNYLDCSDNTLTSLLTEDPTTIAHLNCGNNLLSNFDASPYTNLTYLACYTNGLTSIDVSDLTSLQTLAVGGNNLGSIDVANLINLTQLNLYDAGLTSLDVSSLVNLEMLTCAINSISALNLTNLTHLTSLNCGKNLLTQLDVSACENLTSLGCDINQLTELDVNNNPLLNMFSCSQNQLTTLDLSQNTQLANINFSDNLFETLDFSQMVMTNFGYATYNFSNNPNLQFVNLKNEVWNCSVNTTDLNCPNLNYVCVSEQNQEAIQSSFSAFPNVLIGTYCNFVPAGNYNTIAGNVHVDFGQDGCNSLDPTFADIKVTINDGSTSGANFTTSEGEYSFYVGPGTFSVMPILENDYFTVSDSQAVTLASADGLVETLNFCIQPNGIHYDPQITITPLTPARPGFDADYLIMYKNIGNQVLNGTVSFTYNDMVLDFVNSDISPDSQTLGNLSFNYTNLAPFESRNIQVTLSVNSPMDTPAVNNDDILNFTASVALATGDAETADNNIFHFPQTVVGSYDPNDKTCVEGTLMSQQMVGDYLHYVIRFQNSGTFYAQNVVVVDMIDESKYDVSTLQPIAASHDYEARITGNKVEFIFENIMLPAEQDDEPGSHGFVSFKIKTKPNLVIGNSVSNSADIFFDYNFPIVTEPAVTTVSNLGFNDVSDASVSIFPNPVRNKVNVTANSEITSLELFDVQGRLVGVSLPSSEQGQLDLSSQASGVYFIKVKTEKGTSVQKLIRE